MYVVDVQPSAASPNAARAIRRLMDVAYRIRPLAGRFRLLDEDGRRPRAGRDGRLAHAPGAREVVDQLPGGDHEDRLLGARRLELLAERDLHLQLRVAVLRD